jgi:hypothetical protein
MTDWQCLGTTEHQLHFWQVLFDAKRALDSWQGDLPTQQQPCFCLAILTLEEMSQEKVSRSGDCVNFDT